jgi:hypothetical protein
MLALGACTSPNIMAEGPQYRYSSSDLSGAASDTQALLNGPEAQWIEDYVGGPGNLPEYARRDAALAVAPEASPLLATNQWPQPSRPDLDYTRTLYLPVGRGEHYPVTYSSDRPLAYHYRGHYRPWHLRGPHAPHHWRGGYDLDYDRHDDAYRSRRPSRGVRLEVEVP